MFFKEAVESVFREMLVPVVPVVLSSYTEDKKAGTVRLWLSWEGKLDFGYVSNFLGRVSSLLVARCKGRVVQEPFLHFDFVFIGVKFPTD